MLKYLEKNSLKVRKIPNSQESKPKMTVEDLSVRCQWKKNKNKKNLLVLKHKLKIQSKKDN